MKLWLKRQLISRNKTYNIILKDIKKVFYRDIKNINRDKDIKYKKLNYGTLKNLIQVCTLWN